MAYAATAEQQAVIDFSSQKKSMVVQAGAGTGKTATIKAICEANPSASIRYFAFNAGIVAEAASKLPKNCKAQTIHSYAMGRVQPNRARVFSKTRMSNQATAEYLGLPEIELSERTLSRSQVASLVNRGLVAFAKSADWKVGGFHVPYVNGLMPEEIKQVRDELSPFMQAAWDDIMNFNGKLNYRQEFYIKAWAMNPKLRFIAADIVIIDEAQDVMACTEPVWNTRERYGKPLIIVGDEYQAINKWNGAADFMRKYDFPRFILSKSFRFGQEIADKANVFLSALEADMSLEGTGTSEVGEIEFPSAILCRTNAGAIDAAMREIELGKSVALLGDTSEFGAIAESAEQLQAGRPCDHWMFTAFSTWQEVQKFANSDDPEAADIRTWVKLIDAYGPGAIKDLTSALVDPSEADTTCTTAHKTKGLEFTSVRCGQDFPDPEATEKPLTRDDLMLSYVTATRAKAALELGSLAAQIEAISSGYGDQADTDE